jgi:hypothetical protein
LFTCVPIGHSPSLPPFVLPSIGQLLMPVFALSCRPPSSQLPESTPVLWCLHFSNFNFSLCHSRSPFPDHSLNPCPTICTTSDFLDLIDNAFPTRAVPKDLILEHGRELRRQRKRARQLVPRVFSVKQHQPCRHKTGPRAMPLPYLTHCAVSQQLSSRTPPLSPSPPYLPPPPDPDFKLPDLFHYKPRRISIPQLAPEIS